MTNADRKTSGSKARALKVERPRCQCCGRAWLPPRGVVATDAYCSQCSSFRRNVAAVAFELAPLTAADAVGPYLLPRLLRDNSRKMKRSGN